MNKQYNVWNNGLALRSTNGHWACARNFVTKEQASLWMQRVCIERQEQFPAHLRMNYEVRVVRTAKNGTPQLEINHE